MVALKALLYVLISVFGSSAVLFTADGWTGPERWNVLVLLIGAVGLWGKANTPSQPWAKFLIAVLAAGGAVLTSAWTDRMIEPVEWQQITLAVLGAALVGAAGNAPADGRHERVDDGRARLVLVLVVLAVAGVALLAVPASAHAPHRPAVVTHVEVNGVCTSGNVLDVSYELEDLTGREWTFRQDDGRVRVQLHFIGGRYEGGESWEPVDSASGGEGHRRVSAVQPVFDGVRVEWRGVLSSPLPVSGPCS